MTGRVYRRKLTERRPHGLKRTQGGYRLNCIPEHRTEKSRLRQVRLLQR